MNLNTVAAAGSAPVWAYVGTLTVYVLNGIFFHCWTDPTTPGIAAAWSCVAHLPDQATQAIEGIVTALGTFAVGHFLPDTKLTGNGGSK